MLFSQPVFYSWMTPYQMICPHFVPLIWQPSLHLLVTFLSHKQSVNINAGNWQEKFEIILLLLTISPKNFCTNTIFMVFSILHIFMVFLVCDWRENWFEGQKMRFLWQLYTLNNFESTLVVTRIGTTLSYEWNITFECKGLRYRFVFETLLDILQTVPTLTTVFKATTEKLSK